jgi:predicted protein tyrosine phosphatase
MKLLFICSFNSIRSRTAEEIYNKYTSGCARSAGILPNARIRINAALLEWADMIFTMEEDHADYIRILFPATLGTREIINLNISGEYYFNQPELISEIRKKVDPHLKIHLKSL